MMRHLDATFTLDASGHLSESGRRRIASHLRACAAHLDDGETMDVRVQVGSPKRSTAQNRLYWAVVARIQLAFLDAGHHYTTDALHVYLKGVLLETVCAEYEGETGEVLECVRILTMPDGTEVRTLTTTALTKPAFSLYLMRIEEHMIDTLGVPVDLSDLMDEARSTRQGKISEPSDLETIPFASGDGDARLAEIASHF
ncbi:MAG: hypothetical protein AAF170_18090 [Bacteroidota bacterium]